MKKQWFGVGAIAALGVLMASGCGSDGPPGTGDTSDGAGTSDGSGSGGSGAQTTGSTTDVTSGDDITSGSEITSGFETSTSGETTTDPVEETKNGGKVQLTPEQITAIKEGECAGTTAVAEPVGSVIQLVVDVSQSMGAIAPGEPEMGGRSRWDLALPALLEALDALPDHAAVGLQLFPTSDALSGGPGGGGPGFGSGGGPADGAGGTTGAAAPECVGGAGRVPIATLGPAGSPQRLALSNAMEQSALYLGTPTHDAFHNALEEGLKVYEGPGDKFMLLMTDGAPTQLIGCGPLSNSQEAVGLEPIIAEVAATASAGIRTFVIGSPGSEEGPSGDMRPFMSEVAQVGGTGPEGCMNTGPNFCHLDMTQTADFSATLVEGIANVAEQVANVCVFTAPAGEDVDAALTSVVVEWADGTASLMLNDADADCQEGWVWNANGEIELCAASCEAVKADAGAVVSVSVGCEAFLT